jgi:hypothetical protein
MLMKKLFQLQAAPPGAAVHFGEQSGRRVIALERDRLRSQHNGNYYLGPYNSSEEIIVAVDALIEELKEIRQSLKR